MLRIDLIRKKKLQITELQQDRQIWAKHSEQAHPVFTLVDFRSFINILISQKPKSNFIVMIKFSSTRHEGKVKVKTKDKSQGQTGDLKCLLQVTTDDSQASYGRRPRQLKDPITCSQHEM